MPFRIVRQDIERIKADAVVTIIYLDSMAGKVSIGTAEEAGYRIQCNVPERHSGGQEERRLLCECCGRALRLAKRHRCGSIAFPVISSGAHGVPEETAMQSLLDCFRDFLEEHEMEIIMAVPGGRPDKVSGSLYEDVRSYVEDRYRKESPAFLQALPPQNVFVQPSMASVRKPAAPRKMSAAPKRPGTAVRMRAAEESAPADLDDLLKQMYTDSFEKHLQQLINKKGMKNSEVYTAANISKQYFSKLMKGRVKPSKEKVLALAVGLQLNLDETVDFLRIAGYALSPVSQTDVVVEYFIQKKDYSVMKIDIVLFDYGLPPLSE